MTTMFALVDRYSQCTLRYKTAKFGNGIIDLFVCESHDKALAKLDEWMHLHTNAVTKNEAEELAHYNTEREWFEEQGILTFKDYCDRFFSGGNGWYDYNGTFLGGLHDTDFNLGDNRYYITEVDVTTTNEDGETYYHITGGGVDYTCDESDYKDTLIP